MPVARALSRVQIATPGGATVAVTGLRSATWTLSAEPVQAGAVLSGGAAWATATAGQAGWSVEVDALALPAALRTPGVEVLAAVTAGDALTYYGTAYAASLGRAPSVNALATRAAQLVSAGTRAAGMTDVLEILARPDNLRITADDGTTVSLAWDPPDATYGPIDGYRILGRPASGAAWSRVEQVALADLADAASPTRDVPNGDGPQFVVVSYRDIAY